MAQNQINKYIWVIDAFLSYGRLTHRRLSELWERSSLGDGEPMPRRSFYNYRRNIAEIFGIELSYDPRTFEFYIDKEQSTGHTQMHNWLLDSMSISGMLSNSHSIADRIVLENVPSARGHLPVVVDAMKQNQCIRIDYRSFARSKPSENLLIEPYFVKIFKQRWYLIGNNVTERQVKTYAFDRILHVVIDERKATLPEGLDPEHYFGDCFGITTNADAPKEIVLRVTPTQAKYFRALPLHHSQEEEMHDHYSLFTYYMRNTYDLQQEILSHGSAVEVVKPAELKAQIRTQLRQALDLYSQ